MDTGMGNPIRPERPTTRPSLPENRPNLPDKRPNLPDKRPNLPDKRPNLPDKRPDFPNKRPDFPDKNRPNLPDKRPNIPDRRPPTNRPIINRPVINNPVINNNINTRPSWANINNVTINNINNQWNNTIINRPGMHNWWNTHPGRMNYWGGWGNRIRGGWGYWGRPAGWFGPNWWLVNRPAFGGWHYHYWLPYYPYRYWWTVPTWAGLTTWFSWNVASNAAWQQPIYYDYGTGGNVYISNNMAVVGGQQVATQAEFAESAAVLATVPPPENEEQAAAVEWMPLGTFALSTGEKDTEPTRVLQLAVTKDGIIGGTWYNYQTEQSVSIQGKVDKDTQRVAFRIGENDNLVAETGMFNLTKDEVPLMVHFGTQKTEQFLLIRLQNNEEDEKETQEEEIKLP